MGLGKYNRHDTNIGPISRITPSSPAIPTKCLKALSESRHWMRVILMRKTQINSDRTLTASETDF
jgi:hypothetical protein